MSYATLDLIKIPTQANLNPAIRENRLVVFMVPLSLYNALNGSEVRFADVRLDSRPEHMHDIFLLSLIMNVWQRPGCVETLVKRGFVDTSHSSALLFYIELKKQDDAQKFIDDYLLKQLQSNMNDFGIHEDSFRVADGAAIPNAGGVPAVAAGTNAGGNKKAPLGIKAKIERAVLKRKVDNIRSHFRRDMFPSNTLTRDFKFPNHITVRDWSMALGTTHELRRCFMSWATLREEELGHTLKRDGRSAALRAAALANLLPPPIRTNAWAEEPDSDMDGIFTDDDTLASTPAPRARARHEATSPSSGRAGPSHGGRVALSPRSTVSGDIHMEEEEEPEEDDSFHFDDDGANGLSSSVSMRFRASPDQPFIDRAVCVDPLLIFTGKDDITRSFMCDLFKTSGRLPTTDTGKVFQLRSFHADLQQLHMRSYATSDFYISYQDFKHGHDIKNEELQFANAKGHMEMLRRFSIAKAEKVSEYRTEFARLVLDKMSETSLIPGSIKFVVHQLLGDLKKNGGKLPTTLHEPVYKYCNLSYSGNLFLRHMEYLEQMNVHYFHIDALLGRIVVNSSYFRPSLALDNGDAQMRGMPLHMIMYGPPGIGKSAVFDKIKGLYPEEIVMSQTYESLRASMTDMESEDLHNNCVRYTDEAPLSITENLNSQNVMAKKQTNKNAIPDPAFITQLKTTLSSGRLVASRYTTSKDGGPGVNKKYNADISSQPTMSGSNSPEGLMEAAIAERHNARYFMRLPRAIPYAENNVDKTRENLIIKEHKVLSSLCMLASTLMHTNVIPWPNMRCFNVFMASFYKQLRQNPYIDIQTPMLGDRRSGQLDTAFVHLSLEVAVHRTFLDADAPMRGKPFQIENMFALGAELARADVQTAIIVVGLHAHLYRSPTEYHVAKLLGRMLKETMKLGAADFAQLLSADPSEAVANWRRAERESYMGKLSDGARSNTKTKLFNYRDDIADDKNTPYVFVGTISNVPMYKGQLDANHMEEFAKHLSRYNTSTDDCYKTLNDHIAARLYALATRLEKNSAKRHPMLHFEYPNEMERKVYIFALRDWLLDCLVTHEYSIENTIRRAVQENNLFRGGTYLVPEQLRANSIDESVYNSVPGHSVTAEQRNSSFFPDCFSFFDVKHHADNCPVKVKAGEERLYYPVFSSEGEQANCQCARSTHQEFRASGVEDVNGDLHTVAVASFAKEHKDFFLMAPTPNKQICPTPVDKLFYPEDAIKKKLQATVQRSTRVRGREMNAEERAIAFEERERRREAFSKRTEPLSMQGAAEEDAEMGAADTALRAIPEEEMTGEEALVGGASENQAPNPNWDEDVQ